MMDDKRQNQNLCSSVRCDFISGKINKARLMPKGILTNTPNNANKKYTPNNANKK